MRRGSTPAAPQKAASSTCTLPPRRRSTQAAPLKAMSTSCIHPPRRESYGTGSLTTATEDSSTSVLQKPPKPLLMLAQQHKWREIYDIFHRKDDKYDYETWLRECSNRHSGQTALHLVMKHKPPRSVVTLMIRRMRKIDSKTTPQSVRDNFGTTPLHIAVAVGCKVRVIEELLSGKRAPKDNPASMPDQSGRYPLHMACTKQVIALHTSKTEAATVINLLAVAHPTAVYIKDQEGWTPKFMLQEFAYIPCISRALQPAEQMLIKKHGGNIDDLVNSTSIAPVPVVDLSMMDQQENSVSSIGWDEDKMGTIQQVQNTYHRYTTLKREEASLSKYSDYTTDDSCNTMNRSVSVTECTDRNVLSPSKRRPRLQRHPSRFL